MVSASVSLLTACVLGVFAFSHGLPAIIQSQNEQSASQSNSYNQESYTAIDNPLGPDYVSYDSSSGSSSSNSYEYDSNYLNTNNGLYSTGASLVQQEEQQMESEYSASQLSSDYSNLGGSVVSTQQQQSEYAYNQAQSSLNQVVSY